jgi:hypothetical protein
VVKKVLETTRAMTKIKSLTPVFTQNGLPHPFQLESLRFEALEEARLDVVLVSAGTDIHDPSWVLRTAFVENKCSM